MTTPDTKMPALASCLYEGTVHHRRSLAPARSFTYRLFMSYLDLGELDVVFRGRWLWSAAGPNVAWFRRGDHYGAPDVPLDVSVRDLVEARTGKRPLGAIRLLTHLRYLGYGFNPVSFYYCYGEPGASASSASGDGTGAPLEAIVAEVSNTPWGERDMVVLPVRPDSAAGDSGLRFRFDKKFHVSPFMGMAQRYDWRFSPPGEVLCVEMDSEDESGPALAATLHLERRALSQRELASSLVRYPAMTAKVIGAIYWQALRLWTSGATFHPHPRSARAPSLETP